jgi:predicted outer membrane protein
MKIKLNSPLRLALIAATAIGLTLGGQAFGQPTKEEEGPPRGMGSMAGVGAKPRKADQTPTPAPGAKPGAATAPLSAQDKNFMMSAAKGGAMEVQMGQMATQQGQSPEVKKLGAEMASAHTKANNQLMALANARGVKLDTRHKMDKMSGGNFDQQWLAQAEKAHMQMISEFQAEAKNGFDPELKSWAAKMVPTLQAHLKQLKAAQGKMAAKKG